MDTSTITTSSLRVSDTSGDIDGSISFSDEGKIATFSPTNILSYDTIYDVTLNESIQDLAGYRLTPFRWFFKTFTFLRSPIYTQAVANDGNVALSWNSLPGADYYNVYYSNAPYITTSTGALISGVTSTSYIHTGLTNGDIYYYIVTAVNADGEGNPSEVVSAAVGLVHNRYTSESYGQAYSIAADSVGNSFITGGTDGDLEGTENAGKDDLFVAKYDMSGDLIWIKQLGTPGYDKGRDIAVDTEGNSFIIGDVSGDLAGTGYAGDSDIFLAKYDASGNQNWIKQFGDIGIDIGRGIAVDHSSNCYITGNIGSDVIIAKYDSSGNQLWLREFATTNSGRGKAIAVDVYGNIHVTGDTTVDLAGTGYSGKDDIFIAKYDTSGNQLWIKQLGGTSYDRAEGVSVDTNGNSYITGYTYGNLTSTLNYEADYSDIFIAKYDMSGELVWLKQLGTSGEGVGSSIVVDAEGYSYVAGYTSGNMGENINQGSFDVFFAKYDLSGYQQWIKLFGTEHLDRGYGIALDSTNKIYITGAMSGDVFISYYFQP